MKEQCSELIKNWGLFSANFQLKYNFSIEKKKNFSRNERIRVEARPQTFCVSDFSFLLSLLENLKFLIEDIIHISYEVIKIHFKNNSVARSGKLQLQISGFACELQLGKVFFWVFQIWEPKSINETQRKHDQILYKFSVGRVVTTRMKNKNNVVLRISYLSQTAPFPSTG